MKKININSEIKVFILLIFAYMAISLFESDNIFYIIPLIILGVVLIILWKNDLVNWCRKNYSLFKEIRNREYFFVREEGYRTDIKKRRELGAAVYYVTNFSFLALILIIVLFMKIFGEHSINVNINALLLIAGLSLAVFGILWNLRHYFTTIYYYIIPIIVLPYYWDNVDRISDIDNITRYFFYIIIIYILFTLSMPFHYLRKITRSTLLYGAVFSFLLSLFSEYFLPDIISKSFYPQISSEVIDEITKNIESVEIQEYISTTPDVRKLFEFYVRNLVDFRIQQELEIFPKINFLWTTAYVIGSWIISLKLNFGNYIAKEINRKIEESSEIRYSDLRDLIYYGDSLLSDKILSIPECKDKILQEESTKSFEDDKGGYKKIKGAENFIKNSILNCLKKLVNARSKSQEAEQTDKGRTEV